MAVRFGVSFLFGAAFQLVLGILVAVSHPGQGQEAVTAGLSLPGEPGRPSPWGLCHGCEPWRLLRGLNFCSLCPCSRVTKQNVSHWLLGWLSPSEVGIWLWCLGATLGLAMPLRALLPLPQGPLEIGPGCLLSGLSASSSPALQGCPLRDVVLQGHHIRLRDLSCRVFTLTGRLDDWQVRGVARWREAPHKAGV